MDKTKEQVRREIEQTRLRMGDTVDALMYRADVPARARESLTESSQKAVDYGRTHPAYVGAGAVALGVAAALLGWARRR
jgi:hypothetical protein